MAENTPPIKTKATSTPKTATPPKVETPVETNVVNIPTEQVELPSKGLLYPEGSELSKGMIEMKYMTARDEDILTNQSYIRNGTVFDKLFQSLIKSPI